ncbi:IclR family transcriptional regulator domain-containing protein [Nesterenkonia halobia]|uniref:IclR family transcriptional regulator C-terminal domain-containing protein n=1 Tax=Nesterenkonia halobia TaxID=37922 RepID=A0ABP6RBJ3_9MICC
MAEADDPEATPAASGQFVQSLARGLAVIRTFDADHPQMTLTEVAARAGLSRATARRLLHTLVSLGYVRGDGRQFELTAAVLQLGYSYLSGHSLSQLAQPVLEELSAAVDESASVSVLDGAEIVYTARVHTRRIMRVGISIGSRFPAQATSMGRVLLAGIGVEEGMSRLADRSLEALTERTLTDPDQLRAVLEQVAAQGWALVDQELEPGLRSLAVPVHGADGAVVAALNVSMSTAPGAPHGDLSAEEAVARLLPSLRRAADQLEETLRAAAG